MRALPSTFAVAALVAGCQHAVLDVANTAAVRDSGAAYFPDVTWRTAAPAQVGFDANRVAALEHDVTSGRFGTIDAMIIVRFGHLVVIAASNDAGLDLLYDGLLSALR